MLAMFSSRTTMNRKISKVEKREATGAIDNNDIDDVVNSKWYQID